MDQASGPFATGCCDLEWTRDAGSPSRDSLQADQVPSAREQAALLVSAVNVLSPGFVSLCMLTVHPMQHLVGRLWYPAARKTTSQWFGGQKKCSWSPHYNYAYGEYPSFVRLCFSARLVECTGECLQVLLPLACGMQPELRQAFCSFVSTSILLMTYNSSSFNRRKSHELTDHSSQAFPAFCSRSPEG